MKTYKILYYTYDSGIDPEEITIELDKTPTIKDVEKLISKTIHTMSILHE
jgi:hypothetical protein